MFWYPVHRHRLPPIASRASSGVGSGFSCRYAVTVVTKPGVQKPHCRPWHSMKARWTGPSPPSGARQPSIVVTDCPSAVTAKSRQDRTGTPSSSTVHAPHTPCSQPTCVPV
jgi:hypothetical protein